MSPKGPQPARIWIIISNRWNSAITEYALSLVQSLRSFGYQMTFICLQDSPAFHRASLIGAEIYSLKSFRWQGFFQLQKAFRSQPPEYVVTFGGREMFFSMALKLFWKTKLIRFIGRRRTKPRKSFLYFFPFRFLSAIVTPNNLIIEHFERAKRYCDVSRIFLGMDHSKFIPAETKPAQDMMFILGRLDPVKGHKAFLKDFHRVRVMNPDLGFQLTIVGEPANIQAEEIQSEIENLGLCSTVNLHASRVENIIGYFHQASIGIICSQDSEDIGRVAEEFLLCGIPILVSGVGGLKDLIEPWSGWSYEGLDESSRHHLIKKAFLIAQAESIEKRVQRAEMARAKFSFHAMGQAWDRLLKRI